MKTEKQPLVSVIMPVYNGSNYLKEAIDSALNQTYKNIEIIVVNDGSCDDGATEKIALSYGDRIRYIYKENGGVSSALNEGIKNMKGEYFSWLSHDDLYKHDKIERQLEALNNSNNENALVCCNIELIDSESNLIKKSKTIRKLSEGLNEWHIALNAMLETGSYNGCAMLIPKKVFDDLMFDESLRFSQDAFMWMQIFFKKYSLVYIEYAGVCSRIHNLQLTQRRRDIFYQDRYQISKTIIPKILSEEKYVKTILFTYAKYHAKMNCEDVVKACMQADKENKILSRSQRLKIFIFRTYGKIRPGLRKVYYQMFRKVKTSK